MSRGGRPSSERPAAGLGIDRGDDFGQAGPARGGAG